MTEFSELSRSFSFLDGPHGRIATLEVNCNPANTGRVIMAHGFSASASMVEHAKLFLQTAAQLSEIGLGSILFDFTGNGLSDGSFADMTPNRRIDEAGFMIDQAAQHFSGPLFLLGLSMGGAVSIHAASQKSSRLKGLVTWSCVPSFEAGVPSSHWYPATLNPAHTESPGEAFYTDRPQRSVADTYEVLELPKLQIQGDQDFAFFAEEFRPFFDRAREPKKYVLIKGGDHVFTGSAERSLVIAETKEWLKARL